uniref:Uncharacterized protein n=1 Tax=Noctiluca scintillans TaxID=2966 RepID=A0A7S1ALV0_NOCSC|mmetsp:Transcript_5168/g.14528  ORF Transcript_5168/g.14528 Transcript_5168/m.14528 type:complete len:393 (+) Transcript_5168:40-1218(+)
MGHGRNRGRGGHRGGHGPRWSQADHNPDATATNGRAREENECQGNAVPGYFSRPLAAQWRFACRALYRLAPEERLHDARRQVLLGDHIFTRDSWDFSEQHGIICSAEEHGHGRGRRDLWVAYWNDRLQCVPLSQFSKSGELRRVTYPHWTCRCYVPDSSTLMPHVLEECLLEATDDQTVAKLANNLYQNGGWSPQWTRSPDLEFCIYAKTGQRVSEVHTRKTVSTEVVAAISCAIKGERPSQLFSGAQLQAASVATPCAPPGYAPRPMLTVGELEAFRHEKYAAYTPLEVWPAQCAWGLEQAPGAQVQSHNVLLQQTVQLPVPGAHPANQGYGGGDAMAHYGGVCGAFGYDMGVSGCGLVEDATQTTQGTNASKLSADAEVFVPRNWEGVYQ